jgi:hypothetical protein
VGTSGIGGGNSGYCCGMSPGKQIPSKAVMLCTLTKDCDAFLLLGTLGCLTERCRWWQPGVCQKLLEQHNSLFFLLLLLHTGSGLEDPRISINKRGGYNFRNNS